MSSSSSNVQEYKGLSLDAAKHWANRLLSDFRQRKNSYGGRELECVSVCTTALRRRALYEVLTEEHNADIGFKKYTEKWCVRICEVHKCWMQQTLIKNICYDPNDSGRWNRFTNRRCTCPKDPGYYTDDDSRCFKKKVQSRVRLIALYKKAFSDKYASFKTEDWQRSLDFEYNTSIRAEKILGDKVGGFLFLLDDVDQ